MSATVVKSFVSHDPFKTVRRPTLIDQVEVKIGEAIHLNISGYQTEGSGVPVKVELRREGHHIKVRIYREWDFDAVAPAALMLYQDTIALNFPLASGKYIIDVNHHLVEVKL